ncbi:MAG: SDR family oxidoreductase [Gammaproteobacteria bacterium]|nr:SDR family oxidoreductase [Gammaproteobacteria bacterium]
MQFADQVVWLTGASSGIGEALAYALSRRGARLILSARRAEELERVRRLCDNPDWHWVMPLDLEHSEEFPAKVKAAEEHFGRIDLLINNGGISQRARAQDTALAVDRRIMEINYFGTIALTKAVLPGMLARRAGHIATVTSLVGHFGTPLRSGYAASKHALHGFFDSLRAELWEQGVGVSLICPGFIHTNLSYAAVLGDGSPQSTMDDAQAHGYPATLCAEDILTGLAKGKEEFSVGGRERLGVYLKRFFPGLFSKMIRKAKVV